MKLESFSVENFRSITEARQISMAQSTVLIGPNNEGKSNILRALNAGMFALTRTSLGSRLPLGARNMSRLEGDGAQIYDYSRDLPIVSKKSNNPKQTRITLEFSLSEYEINDFRSRIGSNLNGTLPVCVTFDRNSVDVKIVKQGRGGKSLNEKSEKIAKFLAENIQFHYIPAVRTANHSARIVENIISSELVEIERQPEYQAAIGAIRELQRPILEAFSAKSTETLKSFLPSIRNVKFSVSDERRFSALRQAIDIVIDDGVITSLEAKGDGVQSLVALGLRRHLLEESRQRRSYIFAVEEPEAHLHSDAIHELRKVLSDLSEIDQIIITTHSGLLANRDPISSNIIVRKARAMPAKSLAEIRGALGIRSNDNLINAELVLLVEGDGDKMALTSLLSIGSDTVAHALTSGQMIIESVGGASFLCAKIALYKSILCSVHCFVDDDIAGRGAIQKAINASLITDGDYNSALVGGRSETEFEDLVSESIYSDILREKFGVDINILKPTNQRAKWSDRMKEYFRQAGKQFDDSTKQKLKFHVAMAVSENASTAISHHYITILNSLIGSLEAKIQTI